MNVTKLDELILVAEAFREAEKIPKPLLDTKVAEFKTKFEQFAISYRQLTGFLDFFKVSFDSLGNALLVADASATTEENRKKAFKEIADQSATIKNMMQRWMIGRASSNITYKAFTGANDLVGTDIVTYPDQLQFMQYFDTLKDHAVANEFADLEPLRRYQKLVAFIKELLERQEGGIALIEHTFSRSSEGQFKRYQDIATYLTDIKLNLSHVEVKEALARFYEM